MDLQEYPRNRKSKRKQQPEALDSKICSTFPVMVGSLLVLMPNQQVLPLQYFNFFVTIKKFPSAYTIVICLRGRFSPITSSVVLETLDLRRQRLNVVLSY